MASSGEKTRCLSHISRFDENVITVIGRHHEEAKAAFRERPHYGQHNTGSVKGKGADKP